MHQKQKQLDFDEIVKLVNSPLKKGDTWYLLDKSWYDMCKAYHETGDKTIHPGPIDNSALFKASPVPELPSDDVVDNRPLRSDLSEAEGHFIVVPEKCWNLLVQTHQVVNQNHTLKRKVIETSPGQLIVELQPINLKLCLYGGLSSTVEHSFSRMTTLDKLQQEMQRIFSIDTGRETKLWINSAVFTFKPNNSLSPSKSENNLQSSSPIKLSPTPPPMPPNINSLSTSNSNNVSTPTVVTRQAAKSMQKPIALPDSPNTRSSILSTSTSDSPISTASSSTKEGSPHQTLSDLGVSENAIITIEVINNDGTWPSSRPRYGTVSTRSPKAQPGLCGLSNMGNTCFMNAALQCLSNTPPLTNYILTDKFVEDINPNNPLGMHGEIARTYAELIKVMWSGNNTSFLPREFKCAVSRFAPQFNGFAQQDCQELMAFLLDGLHEDLNRIRNKPYIEFKNEIERRPDEVVAEESWSNYKKRNDSIVVDTFHAMLKSTLVCPGCKLVSVTFDPFCYLSLPLPVKREKQVNLIFLPAPSNVDLSKLKLAAKYLTPDELKIIKQYGGSLSSFNGVIEEHAGYDDPLRRSKGCKTQVPKTGPASEICDIVARIINEERPSQAGKVSPENLIVAELSTNGRISKIYESKEHYNQIGDDIVVVEKKHNYIIPLYIREQKDKSSAGSVITKPLFLHVPDVKFETLYKSVLASLSNITCEMFEELQANGQELEGWFQIATPSERISEGQASMECGDDDSNAIQTDSIHEDDDDDQMDTDSKTNGGTQNDEGSASQLPFDLCVVNSFGSHLIRTLGPNKKEFDYSSKLYLAATFTSATVVRAQFAHLRQSKFSDSMDTFTPKVSSKPTLQLRDCITQFTNIEKLGADDPWYCPKCKKHQQATKKFDIWSLPKVLIIHLKRFSFSRSWRDKIDTLVEFPVDNLDMSSYVLNPEQKKKKQLSYSLIGVANHFGGLGGGHYTAYAKNAVQNAWYSFDDALVTQTSSNNIVTRSAYVLFYQLQE